jgi:hypothetical protein
VDCPCSFRHRRRNGGRELDGRQHGSRQRRGCDASNETPLHSMDCPHDIVVDQEAIYWIVAGSIMKLAK